MFAVDNLELKAQREQKEAEGRKTASQEEAVKKAAPSGTKEKLRFCTPSAPLPRPQDKPFEHALLEKSPHAGAPARPTHPLEKLPVEQLFDRRVLESLPFHRLKAHELSARQLSVLAGLYQWRDSVARAEDECTSYILPDKTLLEIAKQTPVTARRLRRTVVSENKFLEHHLGHVITIVRNAVANSDAFENIAQQLQNKRLEEGHVSKAPFFTLIVDGSLDYSAICGTLKKVLKWMGFDQLTVLIMYKIIPLIESCSEELWPELVDDILDPIFSYFRTNLHKSWRLFLHNGSVQIPDKTPDISLSKEGAYKFGSSLIIQLTRAASELLAVIASPKSNGCSELVCSRSLVGYVLCRSVPRLPVLSLIYYMFGEWKDDEAKMTSVSFCYEVIQVATAAHLDDALSFIKDDVIPLLIRCLAFKSSLKSTQLDVLKELCREAFCCVQNPSQGLMSEEKHNETIDKVFESWLTEQISHCTNAPSHEVSIWKVEEEFREYIAAYVDMLHQVNEMEDCLECDYSSPLDLFDKLKPDFKSKYGIDSAAHDYVWTMLDILSRKMSVKHWQRRNEQMFQFFCGLFDFKPYLQHSSYDDSMVEHVRNLEGYPGLADFLRVSALEEFCEMLLLWEPQFHPMIRKGHEHVLREILHHSTYLEKITYLQPLQPDIGDFPVHLVTYARNYIDNMNKTYHVAKEQARLHEKFDAHLASGALDQHIYKDDALNAVLDDNLLPTQFSVLDHDLIKLSFKRRAKFMDMQYQLNSYYKCVQDAINDEQLRVGLQSLIVELGDKGFFCIADDATDSDNESHFSELVAAFKKQVFTSFQLPDYYVIRGIMDYRAMSLMISSCSSWLDAFEEVVGDAYRRWMLKSHLFWMDTRYYKHHYYDVIQQPFEKIWKKDHKKKDMEEGITDSTME
ncbi:uncharacterized protein LOC124691866 isoform X1 [Lolium rigidum]|uniref:uncharacterized protein LOC124691866 isoform X1 n=1 Tax=Lolium rigidum TaxID=89674 RepID=UPI001F5D6D9D|nr:uncharacterized protein LOC124691866 isoform X1 [Lolium rigidum]